VQYLFSCPLDAAIRVSDTNAEHIKVIKEGKQPIDDIEKRCSRIEKRCEKLEEYMGHLKQNLGPNLDEIRNLHVLKTDFITDFNSIQARCASLEVLYTTPDPKYLQLGLRIKELEEQLKANTEALGLRIKELEEQLKAKTEALEELKKQLEIQVKFKDEELAIQEVSIQELKRQMKVYAEGITKMETSITSTANVTEKNKRQLRFHTADILSALRGIKNLQDTSLFKVILFLKQGIIKRFMDNQTESRWMKKNLTIDNCIENRTIKTRQVNCTLHDMREMITRFEILHSIHLSFWPDVFTVRTLEQNAVDEIQVHISSLKDVVKVFDFAEDTARKMAIRYYYTDRWKQTFRGLRMVGFSGLRVEEGVEKRDIYPGIPGNFGRFPVPPTVYSFTQASTEFKESAFVKGLVLESQTGEFLSEKHGKEVDDDNSSDDDDLHLSKGKGITLHWKRYAKSNSTQRFDQPSSPLGLVTITFPVVTVREPMIARYLFDTYEEDDDLYNYSVYGKLSDE